jgi:hypothetical protein
VILRQPAERPGSEHGFHGERKLLATCTIDEQMAGAFLFRASNAAGGMEKRHLVHPRPEDGLKVICLPISGRKMGKTLLFGASAPRRWAKLRHFVHPR